MLGRITEHPILEFSQDRKEIEFIFEGKKYKGFEGDTVAAALHSNGIKIFRYAPKTERPMGFFCAVGKCSSCLVVINGKPNIKSCITPLEEGMVIERQHGKGELK